MVKVCSCGLLIQIREALTKNIQLNGGGPMDSIPGTVDTRKNCKFRYPGVDWVEVTFSCATSTDDMLARANKFPEKRNKSAGAKFSHQTPGHRAE